MKIRATKKLLNISGIKAMTDKTGPVMTLPGEWYAGPVSLMRPGKLAILFLHHPTYISIILPGKSLNKLLPQLPSRVSKYLKRNGFEKLEPYFQLDSLPEVFSTNSRSMLAHINQIKFDLEYHFAMAETIEDINYNRLEDIYFDYLFGGRNIENKYIRPMDVLNRFANEIKKNL